MVNLEAYGDKIIGYNVEDYRGTFFGTCSTAGSVAAKEVTLSDTTGWELRPGTVIGVKFSNSNTATNVTLNVNGSGARSIYFRDGVYTGSGQYVTGTANKITFYMYDGTNWAYIIMDDVNDVNSVAQYITYDSNTEYPVLMSYRDKTYGHTNGMPSRKSSTFTYNPSASELKIDNNYVPSSATVKSIVVVTELPADASSHPDTLYLVRGS